MREVQTNARELVGVPRRASGPRHDDPGPLLASYCASSHVGDVGLANSMPSTPPLMWNISFLVPLPWPNNGDYQYKHTMPEQFWPLAPPSMDTSASTQASLTPIYNDNSDEYQYMECSEDKNLLGAFGAPCRTPCRRGAVALRHRAMHTAMRTAARARNAAGRVCRWGSRQVAP